MDDILNRPIVLVLNRNWQAINVRTPQQLFVQMAADVATALDIDGENMVPVRWAQWIKLPVRESDYSVSTPGLDLTYELRVGSRKLAKTDSLRQAVAEFVLAALVACVTECTALQQSFCGKHPEPEDGSECEGPTDADFAAFWEEAKGLTRFLPTEVGDRWRRGWTKKR